MQNLKDVTFEEVHHYNNSNKFYAKYIVVSLKNLYNIESSSRKNILLQRRTLFRKLFQMFEFNNELIIIINHRH